MFAHDMILYVENAKDYTHTHTHRHTHTHTQLEQIDKFSKAAGYKVNTQKSVVLRGTFLVVQWLRIYLPMQGTWVRPLVKKLRSYML